jgi:hypothetical protein
MYQYENFFSFGKLFDKATELNETVLYENEGRESGAKFNS